MIEQADHLEVYYAQTKVARMHRLRGKGGRRIEYRHIIDWLVRKPGAFENYIYRDELYPTSRFRMAYDDLRARHTSSVASKQYLKILHLAARENETGVHEALRALIEREQSISAEAVQEIMRSGQELKPATDVVIPDVELAQYDALLEPEEVA